LVKKRTCRPGQNSIDTSGHAKWKHTAVDSPALLPPTLSAFFGVALQIKWGFRIGCSFGERCTGLGGDLDNEARALEAPA